MQLRFKYILLLVLIGSFGSLYGQETRGEIQNSRNNLEGKKILTEELATPVSRSGLNVEKAVKPVVPKSRLNSEGGTWHPVWKSELKVSSLADPNAMLDAPFCEGCALDLNVPNLPYYVHEVKLPANQQLKVGTVRIAEKEFDGAKYFKQSMKEFEGALGEDGFYPKDFVVLGERVIRNKQHYQIVRVYPFRVNEFGDVQAAKSVNFGLNRSFRKVPATEKASGKTATTTSVLGSGSWWKIAVTADGIYKMDYNYFRDTLGIDPGSIDPRQIRIFNNGPGALTQRAGEKPYDDLHENPILSIGEGDGSFDPGDYVAFYGGSPHVWKYSPKFDRFIHHLNIYSDTTYYFLTIGGTGKRISNMASPGGATHTATSTTNYSYYETDLYNPLLSGRVWLGESFDFTTTRDFSFPVPYLASGSNIDLDVRVGARSDFTPNNFAVSESGTNISTISVPTVNTLVYGSYYYRTGHKFIEIPASSVSDGSVDLQLTYSKPQAASEGWLDYIEVQYEQSMTLSGQNLRFFSKANDIGVGNIHEFTFSGANSSYNIWDITNPAEARAINYSLSGPDLSFNSEMDSVRRFVAFNASGMRTPAKVRNLSNQDLHALSQVDFLIITHSRFLNQANELAEFHRDQLGHTVHVVNVNKIYNEFSSGTADPAGIRDFIKMFYDRSTGPDDQIRYVLLFGDGSYDYKNISNPAGSWFVPAYQSRKSQRPTESYTSDDFYGFLDDGEGFWGEAAGSEAGGTNVVFTAEGDSSINTHGLDVSIGRIPCISTEEAQQVVNKIKNYSSTQSFGPWRNRLILVADHKDSDGTVHISQADSYTDNINMTNPCINVEKIYLDNYEMVNTANGTRFPDGKDELLKKLEDGSLIVNYTGHGGETGWSNSKILEIPDINSIENGDKLPIYVTATCEFGRWDDPARQSGAEQVFLREGNGSIAMFTTVRVVFSGPNYVLNTNFYDYALVFDTTENRMPTMGEIFRKTKNASWMGGINNRNFTLMGDPALTLNYPELNAVITKINGNDVTEGVVDSLPSLSLVTIEGEIRDDMNALIGDYDGDLYVTVYDKPAKFFTKRKSFSFLWQKNKVFNGQSTIEDGTFSFQFVVPYDVSYENGLGKVSLYFQNTEKDGGGCNDEIYIGGTGDIVDEDDPTVNLYLNDLSFVDGSITNPDPIMIAKVFDENGINTVGTGIGHELTAVLDDNENDIIVLNEYYTADKNSYQSGSIDYPFEDLPVGQHNLRIKVWDVANNSAEDYITFIVADDAELALGHVLNYPNPFTTNTQFIIEHNQNGKSLDLIVKIFTTSGKMVKSMQTSFFADGNVFQDMTWDGLDDWGDPIGRGVYVYQVTLREQESGNKVSKFEKLVLLR